MPTTGQKPRPAKLCPASITTRQAADLFLPRLLDIDQIIVAEILEHVHQTIHSN